MDLKFDTISSRALQIMQNTNKNLYLTGKAGSGKSSIINYFITKTNKKFVLLGTTGIAAINIGGSTIHSFFGIRPDLKIRGLSNEKKEHIKNTDIFILDEASMLRADLFDKLNGLLQIIMKNNEYMGGKQFVFVGDLYQLPPVVTPDDEEFSNKYAGPFFFHGKTFDKNKFETVELQKVYRQDNLEFVNALNAIRIGYNGKDVIDLFNKRFIQEKDINEHAIILCSTNRIADKINWDKLKELPGEEHCFTAFIKGEFAPKDYPCERVIKLKVGSRVMFTKNDSNYSNGTLGEIVDIFKNEIKIKKDDGGMVFLQRFLWKSTDGEDEHGEDIITGSFMQFPLKLAWAITIHKSQGKTFDNIVIDLGGGAYSDGQTYVARSRCTSFDGVQSLKKLKHTDIRASIQVKEFLKTNP